MRKMRYPAVLVLLAATSCGGAIESGTTADPASPGSPTESPKPKAERVDPRKGGFELGFGEFAIAMEARAIRPGRVTFVIQNGGKLTHGFEIKSESDGGSNSGPGGGDDDEFKIESAAFGPGDTIRIQASLPAGLYELECFVANHDDLGMREFLEVRADAPLVKPKSVGDNEVLIKGFAYKPGTIEVVGGTKVVWRNDDPAQHTVTADGGSFNSDPFGRGKTFSFTFDAPGEYSYFCVIHPTMTGTVRVTG